MTPNLVHEDAHDLLEQLSRRNRTAPARASNEPRLSIGARATKTRTVVGRLGANVSAARQSYGESYLQEVIAEFNLRVGEPKHVSSAETGDAGEDGTIFDQTQCWVSRTAQTGRSSAPAKVLRTGRVGTVRRCHARGPRRRHHLQPL